jgi:hypothetical protein
VAAGWKRVLAGQFVTPIALELPSTGMGTQELVVVGDKNFRSPDAWWR